MITTDITKRAKKGDGDGEDDDDDDGGDGAEWRLDDSSVTDYIAIK